MVNTLYIDHSKLFNFSYSLRTYSAYTSGLPECPNNTLYYITLHYITLHYITLHYITLHYITLHYITLHYITLPWYIATCTVYKWCRSTGLLDTANCLSLGWYPFLSVSKSSFDEKSSVHGRDGHELALLHNYNHKHSSYYPIS